jgi:hypothetical protein
MLVETMHPLMFPSVTVGGWRGLRKHTGPSNENPSSILEDVIWLLFHPTRKRDSQTRLTGHFWTRLKHQLPPKLCPVPHQPPTKPLALGGVQGGIASTCVAAVRRLRDLQLLPSASASFNPGAQWNRGHPDLLHPWARHSSYYPGRKSSKVFCTSLRMLETWR